MTMGIVFGSNGRNATQLFSRRPCNVSQVATYITSIYLEYEDLPIQGLVIAQFCSGKRGITPDSHRGYYFDPCPDRH